MSTPIRSAHGRAPERCEKKQEENQEVLKSIVVGELGVNCYMLWDEGTKDAFVIDPGADAEEILDEVRALGLTVRHVVNTHGHFDHVGADDQVASALGAPLSIHTDDAALLADAHEHAVIFGIKVAEQSVPENLLTEGMKLTAGALTLEVIHTPGHTEGGVCLLERKHKLLFTGDTLFAGSVGRTDMMGGSYEKLMESIKYKLLPLADDTRVFPGHGPETTIGAEKELNPYVSELMR